MKSLLDHSANSTASAGTVAMLAASDPWVRWAGVGLMLLSAALLAWRWWLTAKYGPLDEHSDDEPEE